MAAIEEFPAFQVNGLSVPVVQELAEKLTFSSANVAHQFAYESLPERYVQPREDRPDLPQKLLLENPLQIIDVSLLDQSFEQREKLADACRELGFFHVVNHGIPMSLTERMKGITKEFFKLPVEEKLRYQVKEQYKGYGQAFVVSDDQPLDWADTFAIKVLPIDDMRNINVWPESPSDFREVAESYAKELERLISGLLSILANDLGLTPENRLFDFLTKKVLSFRLNYYPPCPRPDLALGMSTHTDGSILSVLLQDDETVGLHLRSPHEKKWLPVKPIPGALCVHVGDALEVFTFRTNSPLMNLK
eukprot:TRINITY_DN2379_c0_g1_i3.p1 TRINITY_DN2379_c0_g1~~TRINITY_DN2379_c0_g1_i3.p1  ORF type:complete len:305 (-),score=46.97 TRINITY_DN2379_c0_g1_i3:567-1481(-)